MRRLAFILAVAAISAPAPGQRRTTDQYPLPVEQKSRKEKELPTQAVEVVREAPMTAAADAGRLVFRVTPLNPKGLLSSQVREALKWLLRQDQGIVHLRAFVAGSGDIRRVQTVVSEVFTDRKLSLPSLTVVQAGALPEGAQVVLESAAADAKRTPNPDGLAFLAVKPASIEQPYQPLQPLVENAFSNLDNLLVANGLSREDVLCATCYLSSLDAVNYIRQRAGRDYPKAAWNFVQTVREPARTMVQCEAVARLSKPPAGEALPGSVTVGPGRLIFTGMQLGFGEGENDIRLAFQRIGKALQEAGTSLSQVAYGRYYPLSRQMGNAIGKASEEFYGPGRQPPAVAVPCQGLPGIDAAFGIELLVVGRK